MLLVTYKAKSLIDFQLQVNFRENYQSAFVSYRDRNTIEFPANHWVASHQKKTDNTRSFMYLLLWEFTKSYLCCCSYILKGCETQKLLKNRKVAKKLSWKHIIALLSLLKKTHIFSLLIPIFFLANDCTKRMLLQSDHYHQTKSFYSESPLHTQEGSWRKSLLPLFSPQNPEVSVDSLHTGRGCTFQGS